MAKRKAKKKVSLTLREFKTWLEGVQSMQASDWHPDAEQWKMIIEKIDEIEEVVQAPVQAATPAPAPAIPAGNPAAGQIIPQARPAGNPAGNTAPAGPVQRLNLPSGNQAATTRPAPSSLATNPALTPAKASPTGDGTSVDLSGAGSADTGLMTVKPVESEDGSYQSSFS